MTMKEKLLERREEVKKRNTVEVLYADGATGTTTVDKILKEDETPVLPEGISKIMIKKFAVNYANRVLAEMMLYSEPVVFGFVKIHTNDIVNLNDALTIIDCEKIKGIDEDDMFEVIPFKALNNALCNVNKMKFILQDVISDMYGDQAGVGFSKVGSNYVPFYQLPMELDCVLKNGGLEIEVTINPRDLADLDEDLFNKKVCSLKRAIENAVAYELLDQDQE